MMRWLSKIGAIISAELIKLNYRAGRGLTDGESNPSSLNGKTKPGRERHLSTVTNSASDSIKYGIG